MGKLEKVVPGKKNQQTLPEVMLLHGAEGRPGKKPSEPCQN